MALYLMTELFQLIPKKWTYSFLSAFGTNRDIYNTDHDADYRSFSRYDIDSVYQSNAV